MSKKAKLLAKLKSGSINAKELRTLLNQCGWLLDRTKGSHEAWVKGSDTMILATHDKELKRYQIKEAHKHLLGDDCEKEDWREREGND
jgi:predicted RNA binding protein YcfA (HicA-like mRNA interferase family)